MLNSMPEEFNLRNGGPLDHFEMVAVDMAQILASKCEAERLRIGWGMWRSARNMLRRLLRSQHPTWTDEALAAETARRLASGT
jgi:hypothetical protein